MYMYLKVKGSDIKVTSDRGSHTSNAQVNLSMPSTVLSDTTLCPQKLPLQLLSISTLNINRL